MAKKIGLLLGILVLLVLGYVGYSQLAHSDSEASVSVRLGWKHQAQFAGFYIAQEHGFYDDVNLSVSLNELDLNKDQVQELVDGEVDIAIMEAHQVLEGINNGHDLRAVMAVYQINPHALAVRADSGITGPEDFDGKVIGLAGGEGEGNALFRIFIEKFGRDSSVTYQNLGFDTVDDFANRRADIIDVYRTDQPYLAEQQGVPLTVIPLDAYGFSTYGDVVVVSDRMLREHPGVVERFVVASKQGWEYVLDNPALVPAEILKFTSDQYNDVAYQEHIVSESLPLLRGQEHDFGHMNLVSWSTLYESLRQAGVITTEFDVRDIFTNEFIN